MSEDGDDVPIDSLDDEVPVVEEGADTFEVEVEEPKDPLQEALERAETAEKEIAYKNAEIQNIRKRFLAEKSDLIQHGSMGLARKMLTVLADVDRAMNNIEEDDESPLAQGLRLLRNKMWHELNGEGVTAIDAKGKKFDPAKMDAITTIPATEDFPAGMVVDVIEAGYMYKQRVLVASRVVVASDD